MVRLPCADSVSWLGINNKAVGELHLEGVRDHNSYEYESPLHKPTRTRAKHNEGAEVELARVR